MLLSLRCFLDLKLELPRKERGMMSCRSSTLTTPTLTLVEAGAGILEGGGGVGGEIGRRRRVELSRNAMFSSFNLS